MKPFTALLLAFLLLPLTAHACLNDRDTLAEEIKGLPDVVQVVTGRFERNPPLYYQMRLARVVADLKTVPSRLAEYDDAGVACDRLGRDDEAIAWMAKKRVQLDRANAADAAVQEQWYRYNANVGTFWVDRWIRAGADRKRLGEVQKARDYIAEAIKIKPDAHFGREKYQLQVMDWIIQGRPLYVPTNVLEKRHGFPGEEHNTALEQDSDAFLSSHLSDAKDKTKALCGLITLGNAWESIDIFKALGDSLPVEGGSKLYPLVKLRCDEMVDSGHHSLIPDSPVGRALKDILTVGETEQDTTNDDQHTYRQLRAEADTWQRERADYMMARLKSGQHPDTDPTFWNEYHDVGPLIISDSWQNRFYRKYAMGDESESNFFFGLMSAAFLLGLAFLIGGLIIWRIRLRRKRLAPKTI